MERIFDKVVICMDEGRWYLATRRLFDAKDAARYAATIHPSRGAKVLSMEDFLTCLDAASVEVHLGHLTSPGDRVKGTPAKWYEAECEGKKYRSERAALAVIGLNLGHEVSPCGKHWHVRRKGRP